ncbi:MAG: NUDIX domain-containing protein [Christensenellales bacterium]|jgi:8-oxo-dGTP diphosphatase
MKKIEIVGDNYFGKWTRTRTACRGIVLQGDRILLSYETATDQWMIPGDGFESGETEGECCAREVSEETGIVIRPSPCVLQINEYYEEWKWISRYFFGTVIGRSEMQLTERERQVGTEPGWLPVEEAMAVFSRHAAYADTDEMRRGMYLREYTALCELLGNP